MNCPEAEQLCSYRRDHTLSKRQLSALAKHLAHCAACRRREHNYEDLLGGLRDQPTVDSRQDLFQQALARIDFEEVTTLSQTEASLWNRLYRKEKRTMLRSITLTVFAVIVMGTALMEMRLQPASGQATLRKIDAAVAKSNTVHLVSWLFLPNEEEAKTQTWHDGKKPVRFETWMTRDAMSGSSELQGPYLWTEQGYLSYDRSAGKVTLASINTETTLQESLANAFKPITEVQRSAPPGTYLTVKRLEETQWRGKKVYKLQIASGPKKPDPGDAPPEVQQPGTTPPISQMPQVREMFWVDKETDLPVYSEYEKQIQQRWVIQTRSEYEYNRPAPTGQFDPEAVRKAAAAFGETLKKGK